jgi:ParB family chromosome partitioning protein
MIFEEIPLERLMDPAAPVRARIESEGIDELAASILQVGLLQPIRVRPSGDAFEVIHGHRRLIACRRVSLKAVPCIVCRDDEGPELVAQRLHENLFRRDMTPVEEAVVYAELFESLQDVDKVAAMAHVSRAVVERRLAILSGDEEVRDALHDQKISLAVAEILNNLKEPAKIHYLLECAIRDGASAEKVRMWVKDYSGIDLKQSDPNNPPANLDPAGEAVPDPNVCWLCGSNEDQHELRVRLIHASCERLWRREASRTPPEGAPNASR